MNMSYNITEEIFDTVSSQEVIKILIVRGYLRVKYISHIYWCCEHKKLYRNSQRTLRKFVNHNKSPLTSVASASNILILIDFVVVGSNCMESYENDGKQ